MLLYHGSNVIVENPQILKSLRALDFGSGFYLTSDYVQAEKWARLVAKRRQQSQAIVNSYEFNNELANNSLNILKFDSANGEWLDFVVAHRKGLQTHNYDLVIGAVANDSTLPVIDDYMDDRYTKDEAIKRLLPQKLTDQYAFCTDLSLSCLSYQKSDVL